MPDASVEYIRPFVERSKEYIFLENGPDYFRKADYESLWYKIIKKIQKADSETISGLTAHTFRHNYVSELCYQVPKISTKMIARLIGDSEKMVLEVYSHIMDEKENPVDVINSIFSNTNLTT
jgi:integrase